MGRAIYIFEHTSWIILSMRNVSDKTVQKIITHILWSVTFIRLPFIRSRGKLCYSQAGYILQYNMAHMLYVLVDLGYRHIFTMCNTYCFSTATMVARKRHNVTLYVRCLFCSEMWHIPTSWPCFERSSNRCRCIAPYWVFSSNLYISCNVVVQIFYDRPHDKIWGDIGFFGARKSHGHTQNLSVHSEILNTSV
jgi:hypothetical protein